MEPSMAEADGSQATVCAQAAHGTSDEAAAR